ncbi:MAG TPA: isoprenylcysteine carboxylmethyltransferase family protein [Verrucomicrobiae bacterium]|nr:isoprenylcysteine carboxylmethyltransferase family protein [Verrucomicrobiae bacterium]
MSVILSSIIGCCWGAFVFFWLVSAPWAKVASEKESVWSGLAHRLPLACSYVLLAAIHLPPPMNLSVTPYANWTGVIGASVCGLGLLITLWARWTLGRNWSSSVTFKQGHELIRTGPYRLVRHPIYTGLLVMALGTAFDIGQLRCWLALPLMTGAFWLKLRREEKLLVRHFPEQYPVYMAQVKALVPFVI